MPRGLVRRVVLGLGLSVVAFPAGAQPIPRQDLPPELRRWVPWVLDEVQDLGCPRVRGQAVCVWPGRLQLDLGASGGVFSLAAHADRTSDLRLPGSDELWPQELRVDGAPAPAFSREGAPHLRLPAGAHRVSGRFSWSRLPESLSVPAEVGLVDLKLDGRVVARPRRDASGLVWLRARGETSEDGDSLRLQVFRSVQDGIPVFVETRLQLEVAGRARELTLAGVALPASVAVAVAGELPARIEGALLRVQVRGGRYSITVRSRLEGRPRTIARAKPPASGGWPETEVWVFAADERLRQVELAGPAPIDPSRTELPAEWRALPAFMVGPGAGLTLSEVRRGQPAPAPDALTLDRELWLDPDGRGASVRDRFGGSLRGSTRLDLLPPGVLGRAAVDGQDQLVTGNPQGEGTGIELRREALRLEADSRLALGGRLRAVGWSTGVEQLNATLHLPPGWSLIAASGVDRLPGSWTERWTLLAFFFVLIVTLAVYRLFGLREALLALPALVLLHGEENAPSMVFLSLVAAIALRRVVPAGRLGSLVRIGFQLSAVALVVIVVPFARDQVRDALHPQVATVGAAAGRPAFQEAGPEYARAGLYSPKAVPEAPPPPPPAPSESEPQQEARLDEDVAARLPAARRTLDKLSGNVQAVNQALEQDPKAVLQTGPGVPSWTWRTHSLSWTGPVGRDHTMRLVLASPSLNRLLTALRLALLGLFGFRLLAGRWPKRPRARTPPALASALVSLLLLTGAPAAAQENANDEGSQTPGPELLAELKQRLTRPAPCEPSCVTTPSLLLRLDEGRLQIEAEVHAAAAGAWALPGPLANWSPAELRLDGAPALAVAHLGNGFLYLRLPQGVHRILASGPLPAGDSFTLQFADPPRRARAEAPGWELSGLRADGPAEPSILLTRRLRTRAGAASAEGRYPPWLEVTRTFGFGLSWTVSTEVRRLTPLGTPVAVRVPLLAGEAPTRANLVVERGEAAVSLGGDEASTRWESTLAETPRLTLRAPEGRPWSEVWRLQCSAVWPCTAEGLPPVARSADGVFSPEYRPWPGESLTVSLQHPSGVPGQTLTIDSLTVEASPGSRLERVSVALAVRSSREQPLVVRIPQQADVQAVALDGLERPSRPEAGELRLSVPAGSHQLSIRWQQARGIGFAYEMPRVALATPAVNVRQQLTLPPSRWLLWTHGPSWGPAVLFWPYLLFLFVVAYLLGRLPSSPLSSRRWLLLGLGLSQLPAVGALVVAAFVFALAWRAKRPLASGPAFDLLQLLLLGWALVSLALLYLAIQQGLLFRPEMQVAGNGSSDTVLRWYADRVPAGTPAAGVFSAPLWLYRVAMLVWSLWLAAALVRGVGWGFRAFGEGGYWRPLVRPRASGRAGARPSPDAPPPDAPAR